MKLACPACGDVQEREPDWVAKTALYPCPECGVLIVQSRDRMELAKSLAELEAALQRLFGEFLKKE